MTTYASLVEQLYQMNCNRGVKLGLQNSLELHHLLGEPTAAYPVVHVGGTNGKGSVSTKVAAALCYAGYRVGLFTSPHLTSFRERIQINGRMMGEEEMACHLSSFLQEVDRAGIPATFFELTTLFAFDYFARQEVEIAVVEVGLGGRLDATNVVTPRISVVTSIGLDHTALLGETREAIALEKGGIIKQGCPVVLGPKAQGLGLEEVALERSSPLYLVCGEWRNYISENSAIARVVLDLLAPDFLMLSECIERGIAVQPSCRFEREGRVILDVAHNPDGVRRLMETLDSLEDRPLLRGVIGMSVGKDHRAMLAELKGKFQSIHLVSDAHPRLARIEEFQSTALSLDLPLEEPHGDCESVVRLAMQQAELRDEFVVVCGSCFLMGAAQRAVGRTSVSDPQELNEIFQV